MIQGLKAGQLTDFRAVRDMLRANLLSQKAASEKARLFQRATTDLINGGVSRQQEVFAFYIPGRIEILGKHTDYGGGRSLVAAPERGICLVATAVAGTTVRMTDSMRADAIEFDLHQVGADYPKRWARYPMTVARRLAKNFPGGLKSAEITFASDLPSAAGMSSSSALIVATFLALAATNRLSKRPEYLDHIHSPEDLAVYLGAVENGNDFRSLAGESGVGTHGGSEDHVAILCSRPGSISQYRYLPANFERLIPLCDNYVLAISASGVVAQKTAGAAVKYESLARQVREIAKALRVALRCGDAPLGEMIESLSLSEVQENLRMAIGTDTGNHVLYRRLEQFFIENRVIIPACPDRLDSGSLPDFGSLVDRSQLLAESNLGNQVDETIWLTAAARRLGAAAASSFGAGFGGSVWALVEERTADKFVQSWAHDYGREFSLSSTGAKFFTTRLGPPAFALTTLRGSTL